jgi:cysteine synthase
MTPFDVTVSDIEAARERIAGLVRRTPTYASAAASEQVGRTTFLKLECLQKAGSFKVRGVSNKALSLSDEERRRGLVTVSGGNHAIAVAHVAGTLGIDALVLMPKVTPRFNVELATRLAPGSSWRRTPQRLSPRLRPTRAKESSSSTLTTIRPSSQATGPSGSSFWRTLPT